MWQPKSNDYIQVHNINAKQLNLSIAQDIAQRLEIAIDVRGFAVLSVSGGKSPVSLFEELRCIDLDWSRVRVTLVDERYVPRSHIDSNANLVQTHLCKERASGVELVYMVESLYEPLPSLAAQVKIAGDALIAAGTADVLVLGMGTDGHTASLFPDAANLIPVLELNNKQVCASIELLTPPANAPHPRITQTLAQILSARHIVLPIAGEDKLRTLQLAWGQSNAAIPISYVLNQFQTPLALWLSREE
jgi:6-phosphogluconolactonase